MRSSASFARSAAVDDFGLFCGIYDLFSETAVIKVSAGTLIVEHWTPARHGNRYIRIQVDFGVEQVIAKLLVQPLPEAFVFFDALTEKGLEREHVPSF